MLAAGRLRHRIAIQEQVSVRDLSDGSYKPQWITVFDKVPAAIEPLSVKELIAADAKQSEISLRIVIRYRKGIKASMRAIGLTEPYKDVLFNLAGPQQDKESGNEYITIPASTGTNDGQ